MSQGMKGVIMIVALLFVSIIGRGVWLAVSEVTTAVPNPDKAPITTLDESEETAVGDDSPKNKSDTEEGAETAVNPQLTNSPISAPTPTPRPTATPLPNPTSAPTTIPNSPIQIRVSSPMTIPSGLPVSVVWEVELIQGAVTEVEIVGLWEAMLTTEPDGSTVIEQSLAMSETVSILPHLWRVEGVLDPNAGEGELRFLVTAEGWSREIAFPWVVGETLVTTEQQLMLAP